MKNLVPHCMWFLFSHYFPPSLPPFLPPSLFSPLPPRTGGVYIPPFKLAQMRAQMEAEGKKEVREGGREGGGREEDMREGGSLGGRKI